MYFEKLRQSVPPVPTLSELNRSPIGFGPLRSLAMRYKGPIVRVPGYRRDPSILSTSPKLIRSSFLAVASAADCSQGQYRQARLQGDAIRIVRATVLIILSTTALAQTRDEKLCILSAAQKLPTIPGITIIRSRAKDETEAAKKSTVRGGTVVVEIDISAAGVEGTFKFVCGYGPREPHNAILIETR
jgi:hypothetical protein